jgi:formamidopyrimidine-DNA glycosylase
MPELPEVETVIRELQEVILKKKIVSYSVLWENTFRNDCPKRLEGQEIVSVRRKGKYIIVELSVSSLIIHLRMTGKLLFSNTIETRRKHDRFILNFTDKSQLIFNDVRKFGRIYHVINPDSILVNVGIDALDEALTAREFCGMLKNSRRNIKSFLLSQAYFSGLCNIYTDEALFRAGISPFSICAEIPEKTGERLFDVIRETLIFAVKNMGTTISDYRDAFGNFGNHQNFLRVYQRTALPCFTCGEPIKKIVFGGRSTHYCPSCQKTF